MSGTRHSVQYFSSDGGVPQPDAEPALARDESESPVAIGKVEMEGPDEFRKRAEECRRLAAITLDARDKAFWFRSAEDWMNVAAEFERQNPDKSV